VEGLVVAPGFIDMHSHPDWRLWGNRRAESKIRQGVTTKVVGNCGFSPAPLEAAHREAFRGFALYLPAGMDLAWTSMGEYLRRFGDEGCAVNIVQLVGHAGHFGSLSSDLPSALPTLASSRRCSALRRPRASRTVPGSTRATWCAGNPPARGLPGDPYLAEDDNETVDPQGVRRGQSGRAYTLLDGVPDGIRPGWSAGFRGVLAA
jgi:Amidohydrolase family